MSYKQLENGKHQWDFRLGKKRLQVTHADFKLGERQVRQLKYEWEHGISNVDLTQRVTFYRLCDEYLEDRFEEMSERKRSTLSSQIRCFKRDIADFRLTQAHYNIIDKWARAYRKAENRLGGSISPVSVNRKFNTLRAIFNFGMKKGYLRNNPCKQWQKLPEPQSFPRYLTADEILGLLASSRSVAFTRYCTLGLHTGMRPEEMLSLDIGDIDMEHRVLYVLAQKNGDKDTIEIDDELARALPLWMNGRKEGTLLNYSKGQLRGDAEFAIEEAGINKVKKAGCGKFTIYGLRHTFASHLLMAGEKIETVAKWLRHKDINITYKHYGHLTKRYLRDAANRINLAPVEIGLKVVGGDI